MDNQDTHRTLFSPNKMVWEYFEVLRRAAANISLDSHVRRRQEVLVCLMMSYASVEVFVNTYFRILVEQERFSRHRALVLEHLEKRMGLEGKLRVWPRRILGADLDRSHPKVETFYRIKELRNELMHFVTTHESLRHQGIVIHGLADASSYDELGQNVATEAVEGAEGMLEEILRLTGISKSDMPHYMHQWAGKPPGL